MGMFADELQRRSSAGAASTLQMINENPPMNSCEYDLQFAIRLFSTTTESARC
jgi:hypothetical protein